MTKVRVFGTWEDNRIRARIFVGREVGNFQLAGDLLLHVGEWQIIMAALGMGAKATHGHLEVDVQDPLAVSP